MFCTEHAPAAKRSASRGGCRMAVDSLGHLHAQDRETPASPPRCRRTRHSRETIHTGATPKRLSNHARRTQHSPNRPLLRTIIHRHRRLAHHPGLRMTSPLDIHASTIFKQSCITSPPAAGSLPPWPASPPVRRSSHLAPMWRNISRGSPGSKGGATVSFASALDWIRHAKFASCW